MTTKREWTVKLLPGGRITIPAQLRRELGLSDGDEVMIYRRGREIVITRRQDVDPSVIVTATDINKETSRGKPDDAVHPGSA